MQGFVLYKHQNNTDVALFPLTITRTRKFLKIKCDWYNIVNPNNVFNMGITDEVQIKLEDLDKWKKLPEQYQKQICWYLYND